MRRAGVADVFALGVALPVNGAARVPANLAATVTAVARRCAIDAPDGVRRGGVRARARDATAGAVLLDAGAELSLTDVADVLLSAGLPKYKLPEELVFWDGPLPLNANGKVERNTLDARSHGRPRVLADRLVAAT